MSVCKIAHFFTYTAIVPATPTNNSAAPPATGAYLLHRVGRSYNLHSAPTGSTPTTATPAVRAPVRTKTRTLDTGYWKLETGGLMNLKVA